MRCSTCQWWERCAEDVLRVDPTEPKESQGRCRFRAPQSTTEPYDIAEWPWTYRDDWCGEYRSKRSNPSVKGKAERHG